MREDDEDLTIYKGCGQTTKSSIRSGRSAGMNLLGWNDAGKEGTKSECLAYIEKKWTDMRPLSLRKKMDEMAQDQGGE